MKRAIKEISGFLTSSFILFFIISNLLLLLSNARLLYRTIHNEPNVIDPLIHIDAVHDYYVYLGAMERGASGDWLYHDTWTSEKTNPGFFYIVFVLTGKIGSLLHISMPVTYHLVRILTLELFFILIYILCKLILGPKSVLFGSLLVILASTAPPTLFSLRISPPPAIPWWLDFDLIEKFNLPLQYIVGYTFLILIFILAILFFKKLDIRLSIAAVCTTLIGGLLFPMLTPTVLITFPLAYFLWIFRLKITNKLAINLSLLIGFYFICLAALIITILVKIQMLPVFGYPWNIWISGDLGRWNYGGIPYFEHDFFLVLGLLPILAIPAIIQSFMKPNFERLSLSIWAVLPFLLFPFANLLSIPRIRLIENAWYVPFGILSAYTLTHIKPFSKGKILRLIMVSILICLTIPYSYQIFIWRYNETVQAKYTLYRGIDNTTYIAIEFIKQKIPKENRILAEYTSQHICAYAPVYCYFGEQDRTKDFNQKFILLRKFYSGEFDETAAEQFTRNNSINYIFFGPLEKKYGNAIYNYRFLKDIYRNPDVTIFQVV